MIAMLVFGVLMFGAGFLVGSGFVLMLLHETQQERQRLTDAPIVRDI